MTEHVCAVRVRQRKTLPFLSAALVVCGLAAPAAAVPVKYRFTGVVNEVVSDVLPDPVNIGDQVNGLFIYDTEMPLESISEGVAAYVGPPPGTPAITLRINGSTLESPPGQGTPRLSIENGESIDQLFLFDGLVFIPSPFPLLVLRFVDDDALAFSDTSIPSVLDFNEFESATFGVPLAFGGTIDSLQLVPEPSSLALLAIATFAIMLRPCRRTRRRFQVR